MATSSQNECTVRVACIVSESWTGLVCCKRALRASNVILTCSPSPSPAPSPRAALHPGWTVISLLILPVCHKWSLQQLTLFTCIHHFTLHPSLDSLPLLSLPSRPSSSPPRLPQPPPQTTQSPDHPSTAHMPLTKAGPSSGRNSGRNSPAQSGKGSHSGFHPFGGRVSKHFGDMVRISAGPCDCNDRPG